MDWLIGWDQERGGTGEQFRQPQGMGLPEWRQ